MVPQGINPTQIAPYCFFTQGETCCDCLEKMELVVSRSLIQLQAIELRSQSFLEPTSLTQPKEPLSSDITTNHFLMNALGVRCMALTPFRKGMITLLNLLREIDRIFEEYDHRNKGAINSIGKTKYHELSHSLRQTPLRLWNLIDAKFMGYSDDQEKKMLDSLLKKIVTDRSLIVKNISFFQLIGCHKEVTIFAKMLGAFQAIFKTQAAAEKILPFLAFPLDGSLDRQLGAPFPLDPFPGFDLKELGCIPPSLEYVASCIDRSQALFLDVAQHVRKFIKKEADQEKKQLLVEVIENLELLLSAYNEIRPNIDLFISQNKLKELTSTCPRFFETGVQDLESLHKVVQVLGLLSEVLQGFILEHQIYSKVYTSVQNLVQVFPQFPDRICIDLITDVEFPFIYLTKLHQHLVLDHFQYLKNALESTQRLLQSTNSKSSYLQLIDLWGANILQTPLKDKAEDLKILYNYLSQELKPLFGTPLEESLQKTLNKLDPAVCDFVHITPYSKTLGLNLHHKFYQTSAGNFLGLDIEAIQFMQKNLSSLLSDQTIADTISSKILSELKRLHQSKSIEEFLDIGKQFFDQNPQVMSSSQNIVSIVLQPLIRYLEIEILNEAFRFTPSPTPHLPKKKSFFPHSGSPTPMLRRPPSFISHRALAVDFSAKQEPIEEFRSSPITQSLIQAFHSLHLDPTVVQALEGLKQQSSLFKSPLLFYDETLNLFHNLLELLLDPKGLKNHELLKMVPLSIALDQEETELLTLLEKDRQHRLSGKNIPESIYPHHNNYSISPHLEEEFHKHQKIFFSLVLKCLKSVHKKELDQTGLTLLEPCSAKTFVEKTLDPKISHLSEILERLRLRRMADIPCESPQDCSIRTERFDQQTRKIEKSLRALRDIDQILHPDSTEMVDFSMAHQALYHLSLLTESVLIQLLLTKPTMSRTEENRHIVFETVDGNRPLYNDHNTSRILQIVLSDTALSAESKAQIDTFRNFSNIVFRYLSHAQGHCHGDYLFLLKNLNLIAKDLETLYSGFTTSEMKDLLKTDDIEESVEKIHAIQKEAYKQIVSTIKKTFDALIELMAQHGI
jgi:hypothetical protein